MDLSVIVGNGLKPFQNGHNQQKESTTNKRNGLKPFPTYGLSGIIREFNNFHLKIFLAKIILPPHHPQ